MVSRYQEQAQRLQIIGEIFLDLDPTAQQTGIAQNVEKIWMLEEDTNSVENTTSISIRRGQELGAIEIVYQNRRVDLGYQVPTISFDTGSTESDRQAAADLLDQNITALQGRTPQEIKADKWNEAMKSSVLRDETIIIALDPASIEKGKIKIQQSNNIVGLSYEYEVPLIEGPELDDQTSSLLNAIDFNLLSKLQQIKDTVKTEIAKRIDSVIKNFLGE